MTAPVDIANLALDAIGARATVSSINPSDGTQAGDVISRQYALRFAALARSAHWNCLRRQGTLTLLKAAIGTPENPSGTLSIPPQPWLYEYELPTDYIYARFIPALFTQSSLAPPFMTTLALAQPPAINQVAVPFIIAIDLDSSNVPIKVLLTNWSQAQLVYTANVTNPDLWDTLFQTAFVATLASFCVNPLNRNAQLAGECASMAKIQIDSARATDGNEGPTSVDHLPDFIAARGYGAYVDNAGGYCMAWQSMVFPDGLPY